MADSLSLSFSLTISGTWTNDLDLVDPKAPISISFSDSLTNGTGADQADVAFWDSRSVSSGTPDDIDLAGSLTDPFGATITFARIKGIMIKHNSASNNLQVGGDGSAAFINWVANSSDIVNIGPGGCFFLYQPGATAYAVTATTADILQIAASAGTINYDIFIVGATA